MLELRPWQPTDAERILSWIKDEETFRKWCADRYDRYPISPEDMNRNYAAMAAAGEFYSVTAFNGQQPVGHMILRRPDAKGKEIRFGFIIVDAFRRGEGIGRQMLRLAMEYAFGDLQASVITLSVFENNPSAHRCYVAAGFRDARKPPRTYTFLGQPWRCLEMECGRETWQRL